MPTSSQHTKTPPAVSLWPAWHENKPFALVLLLTFAFLIVFLMARTTLALGQAKRLDAPTPYEHQITVDGTATVTGVPDIATVTLGVDTKGLDVATAQPLNSASVNALVAKIAELGVPKDDIQTANYSVYENTQWNPDTQAYDSSGWIVSQQVTVKVRDTSKISAVLDAAGKNGATSISGPNFTIDDTSNLKADARAKAVADAMAKADGLAKTLGVRLDGVISYSESDGSMPGPYYAANMAFSSTAPDVLPGTNDVTLNVSITYKLAE
jgi:hypothetical protein